MTLSCQNVQLNNASSHRVYHCTSGSGGGGGSTSTTNSTLYLEHSTTEARTFLGKQQPRRCCQNQTALPQHGCCSTYLQGFGQFIVRYLWLNFGPSQEECKKQFVVRVGVFGSRVPSSRPWNWGQNAQAAEPEGKARDKTTRHICTKGGTRTSGQSTLNFMADRPWTTAPSVLARLSDNRFWLVAVDTWNWADFDHRGLDFMWGGIGT